MYPIILYKIQYIINIIIKNVSSSISHKNWETVKLWDFCFFLSSTLIYEAILIWILWFYTISNIIWTQFFNKWRMTLEVIKGHIRSFQNCQIIISAICNLFNDKSFKTFQECQHYEDDLKGHPRSCKNTFMPKSF